MFAMPFLQQDGKVFVGPGAKTDAQVIGLGLAKLSSRQKDDLDRAKRFAMDVSIKHVLMKQQISHQQNQQKVAMYAQALSLMARVYIGSISFEVREDNLKQSFSVFGPIKSINMSWDAVTGHHKGFAFLEYEVPEAALLAQEAMNGKLMGGRNLKVGRPSNMPQAQPIIEMVTQEAKQYHRVYVASVHPDLSETDLRSVFEAFGEITKVQLAKQPGGRGHRGFGYIEFRTAQAVKEAIEGMNNFDLGGQYLQVGRCITPPEALTYIVPSAQSTLPTAAAVAAAAVTAKIQAQEVIGNAKSRQPLAITAAAHSPSPPAIQAKENGRSDVNGESKSSSGGRRRGFGGFAAAASPTTVVEPLALPPPTIVELPLPSSRVISSSKVEVESPKAKPAGFVSLPTIEKHPNNNVDLSEDKKPLPEKRDLISRIKIKQKHDPMQKATFSSLPTSSIRDQTFDEDTSLDDQKTLAITGGGEMSVALALREDSDKVALIENEKSEKKKSKSSYSHSSSGSKKSRSSSGKPKKERKPKLNNANAIAAVFKAGAINDTIQAANQTNEEISLASQEHVEIRGNDARHMLMHKLMRTNRSPVIVLRNMVTSDGVDDELENEIREECSKFGSVTDVVIVEEKDVEEVRIFVRFADPTHAENAISVLDGRYFDGRIVEAKTYDQILFEHDDFTG